MTIREVITRVDNLVPNSYEDEEKLSWLEEIENQIYKELVLTHEIERVMTNFRDQTSELIAPSPYDNLYISYLQAKINFYQREFMGYNNAMAMFNSEYKEFANWFNRTYYPKEM